MGWHRGVSSIAAPPRMRALSSADYERAFYAGEDVAPWTTGLGSGSISPELALTLSYVYCAASTVSDDLGTMTCQFFRDLGDEGRARVRYSDPGIGGLARMCRWQPNYWQTAKAFWSTMAWQYLLRPACYGELIYRPQMPSVLDQIIPRHPDRVTEEMLPSGRVRFKLREANGTHRYVTQDEMFCVRNTSTDGLNGLSRVQYGGAALASALVLQEFTKNYFKKGATASLLGAYKGEMDAEDEKDLHASISRYMAGSENAGGLMLVSADDLTITALGVDPEKAELLGLKNLSGRDVARLFKMPASWLQIEGAQSYGSQIQDAQNYISRCLTPIVVEFEQSIQRDLIIAKDTFFAKFNLDYLVRGQLLDRMQAYEIGIRNRIIRPSDARVREDLNPDRELDRLSEGDYRPGASGKSGDAAPADASSTAKSGRAQLAGMLAIYDNATRCLRRERAAVEKLAKKHANDVDGWHGGLRDFYSDHAGFVAQTMRISIFAARNYAAKHGAAFEESGAVVIDGDDGAHWERSEAQSLAALALDCAA